jgi:hypothetical protein
VRELLDCVTQLVAAARAGDLAATLAHLRHLLGLQVILPDHPPAVGVSAGAELDECCDQLEACRESLTERHPAAVGAEPEAVAVAALDPALLMKIIELALFFVERLRRR